MDHVDATNAPTKSFDPTAEHRVLLAMAGTYEGPTETWFDPDKDPERSTTHATVEVLLGGRFIRIDYRGTAMGAPHAGQMILGFHRDAALYELAWIDSFHTGTATMLSTGAPSGEVVSVLGGYTAGSERWGWRTTLRRDGTALVIEAFNITPAGDESRAVRSVLRARSSAGERA